MQDPVIGELEFEADIPEDLICSICLCPAKDPQQTRCVCAKLYCLDCVKKYAQLSKNCPTCRKPLDVFPDGLSARRIKSARVKCTNAGSGCPWVGEMGDLASHLRSCECAALPCANGCGETVVRKTASLHNCPLQRYSCPHCGEEGSLIVMTGSHLETCPDLVVACPNGCGAEQLARKNAASHRSLCPRETVGCPYASVGCPATFPREELEGHKAARLQQHLDLAMLHITSTLGSQGRAIASLESSVGTLAGNQDVTTAQLNKRVSALEAALTAPVVFRMSDFTKHKSSKEPWFSPGFYTHLGGYKACLRVYANGLGDAEGTHLSVFVNLMRGQHDHALVWPLRADFTVSLLNQVRDVGHKQCVAAMHSDGDEKFNMNVVGSEVGSSARGHAKFVTHQSLLFRDKHHQYLVDETLYFKVDVDILPVCKPWLLAAN